MSKYIIHKGQKYVRVDETDAMIYFKNLEKGVKSLSSNLKAGTDSYMAKILKCCENEDDYGASNEIQRLLTKVKSNVDIDLDKDIQTYKSFKRVAEDCIQNI